MRRLMIIRATHEGVRWRRGKKPQRMKSGLHWYWPLVTEVELAVVAHQPLNLVGQTATTKDGQEVIVSGFIVFNIRDVVLAIGERNFDVDDTVGNIAQAAIFEIIMGHSFDDLRDGFADRGSELSKALTVSCRKQLSQFGVSVHRCGLTDFSKSRVYRLVGNDAFAA